MSKTLAANLANRKWLASRLRAEIVGPDPAGTEEKFLLGGEMKRLTWEEYRKPKRQDNGEEVVWQDPPAKRYGSGILFPIGVMEEQEQLRAGEGQQESPDIDPGDNQNVDEKLEKRAERNSPKTPAAMDESEDYAVTLANAYRPSAIGLSFLADFSMERAGLRVEVVSVGRLGSDDLQEIPAATYRQVKVLVGDPAGVPFTRAMWLRVPLLNESKQYPFIDISASELLSASGPVRKKLTAGQGLEIVLVSRGYSHLTTTQRLITISLVNRKQPDAGNLDEQCLFQAGIRVRGQSGSVWIRPYRETEISTPGESDSLSDQLINQLLYRQYQTFAIWTRLCGRLGRAISGDGRRSMD